MYEVFSSAEKKILGIIAVVCLVLIIASCANLEISPPAGWLVGWTSWFATVIGTVVGARVFWIGGSGLRKYLNEGRLCREDPEEPKR